MAQWEFVDWLLYWLLETSHFEFEWDEGNRYKNAIKHSITTEEIESIFRLGLALPLGIQISPQVNEQRLGIVGPSVYGKFHQVAFVLREGKVRVISARRAHKKEVEQYEKILREIER